MGIITGIHYKPQHQNPVFSKWNFNNQLDFERDVVIPATQTLSIPLHNKLTKEEVNYIIKTVKECNV